jgi:hypothetical protein
MARIGRPNSGNFIGIMLDITPKFFLKKRNQGLSRMLEGMTTFFGLGRAPQNICFVLASNRPQIADFKATLSVTEQDQIF